MTGNEYQNIVKKTWCECGMAENHSLHGMSKKLGDLHALYQNIYQGYGFDEESAKKEIGGILAFIAEYCTAMDWKLDDVMQANINNISRANGDS